MAKLIILEGTSRTGKTTIANYLKDNGYGRIISLKNKMPEDCDLSSFYKGTFMSYDAFFQAFPEETFILDRSFLSEMVYSAFFNRKRSISNEYISDFIKTHDIRLFHLWNKHEDYINRGPKESFTYTSNEYDEILQYFAKALDITRGLNWTTINTSEYSINESINIIKQNVWTK